MTANDWALVLAEDAEPLDPDSVSPGVLGFLVFFALAIATILLIRSFTAHMRKVDRNERRRVAEAEAAPAPADDDAAGSVPVDAGGSAGDVDEVLRDPDDDDPSSGTSGDPGGR